MEGLLRAVVLCSFGPSAILESKQSSTRRRTLSSPTHTGSNLNQPDYTQTLHAQPETHRTDTLVAATVIWSEIAISETYGLALFCPFLAIISTRTRPPRSTSLVTQVSRSHPALTLSLPASRTKAPLSRGNGIVRSSLSIQSQRVSTSRRGNQTRWQTISAANAVLEYPHPPHRTAPNDQPLNGQRRTL
jgi:hypothetical protein